MPNKPLPNNNIPVVNHPPAVNRPPPVAHPNPAEGNKPPVAHQPIVTPTVPHINIPIHTAGYTSTVITHGSKPNVVVTVKEIPDEQEIHLRSCYRGNKKVPFSQYWIPKENEWDETNGGKRVFLGGDIKRRLMDKDNVEVGLVPVDMYEKCRMEGTCLLENGDLINIDSTTDSFIKVGRRGREHNVFGLGSGSQNLVPFVSIAANDLPYGQTFYIPQLDGLDLGGNQHHNGCVRVDDDSWSFDSCQIDFFVLSYVDYLWLDLSDKVTIKPKKCQIKNYITKHHLSLVKATNNEKIIPSLLNAKYVVQ
ncbi:uncharacterized protein EV154DRAFT_431555 [Mucor mucedo]|uniref:uncharacterized protein n=1 Tax=Mucor mucedo TaxID=29922 RepID=UPI00221E5EAD|nr:uncharacterized protein EV154DRAFT_431555 [Mucor mucedo]KAI7871404.1 hypothetical protein EV154DRAFT_431555 [Mucor mucedo]